MRKVICYENALAVGNHFLLESSVQWDPEKRFPVVWNFSYELHSLLGWATELRREEDGSITAELEIVDEANVKLIEDEDLPVTFEGNEVREEMHDGVREISNVKIRGISVVLQPAVPW